jgi:hypothetical protein
MVGAFEAEPARGVLHEITTPLAGSAGVGVLF